jgi:putative oxidoreductase
LNRGEPIAASGTELVGRFLLALLFILEGVSKINAYGAAASYMTAFGLPPVLLLPAIGLEVVGGLLIVIGLQTRVAAIALAAFCVVTAVVFHTKFGDRNQLLHFEKDLALAGAFLLLGARGAGRLSLDKRIAARRQLVGRALARRADSDPGARAAPHPIEDVRSAAGGSP